MNWCVRAVGQEKVTRKVKLHVLTAQRLSFNAEEWIPAHLGSREPGAEHIKRPCTRWAVMFVSPVKVPQLQACRAGALAFGRLVADCHEDVPLLQEHSNGIGGKAQARISLAFPLHVSLVDKSHVRWQICWFLHAGTTSGLGMIPHSRSMNSLP